ncbi:hypothetical protein ACHAWF_000682 [Thalassiosira exigua]
MRPEMLQEPGLRTGRARGGRSTRSTFVAGDPIEYARKDAGANDGAKKKAAVASVENVRKGRNRMANQASNEGDDVSKNKTGHRTGK